MQANFFLGLRVMESLTSTFQKAMASPAVKKLRALEQQRVARASAKHTARRERFMQTLQHVDTAIKTELKDSLKTQADDLLEIAKIFEEEQQE